MDDLPRGAPAREVDLFAVAAIALAESPTTALYVEPIPAALVAASRTLYLPIGFETRVADGRALVLEVAPMGGPYYPCDAGSDGAIASVGYAIYSREEMGYGVLLGPFVAPEVRTRVFHTSEGSQTYCGPHEAAAMEGWDAEIGAGADFGFAWSSEKHPLFAAVVFGLSANVCVNCVDPGDTFLGDLCLLDCDIVVPERRTGATLAFNAALFRTGFAW